jgi:AraC family transcriptional regulator
VRKGYEFDDLSVSSIADIVVVPLDDEMIVQFQHDDAPRMRADFLDHVVAADSQIVGLVDAMLSEVRAGSPSGSLFSQSVSVALLAHVYDRYERSKAAKWLEGRLSAKQTELLECHIREHIDSDLSIVELAKLLDLSPAYFCRAFSKTVGAFIMNFRIELARERLRQRATLSLDEIALGLGFADRTHLSNVFRKLVGISPSEFRRLNK